MSRGPARPAPTLPGLRFVQHLGTGGYADVFLYEQSQPVQRMVAVKVLHVDDLDDALQRKFETEANTMAQLSDHPFIVPVMWADVTDDGRPYIVMKYYPKPNLAVRARRERFSVMSVLQIGIEVSSAVETAHRARILHRDIKPANVLTDQYDNPGLTDFGIAATTADSIQAAEGMSVPWSPPEILFGMSEGDHRSDVYSLGATLWHLLGGRAPYERADGDNSHVALMRRVQQDPVPNVPRNDVPESLHRLLRQTLAKSPDGRPQSTHALARELQAIEQEQRFPLTRIVVPEPARPGRPVPDDDEEDVATWVRSVRIIESQLDQTTVKRPDTAPPHAAPSSPPAPAARRAPVPAPVPAGPHRAAAVADPPARGTAAEPAEEPSDRTVKRAPAAAAPEPTLPGRFRQKRLVAGGVAALVLVLGVVAVSTSGGAKDKVTEPPVQDDGALPPPVAVAPGVPRVTVKRLDGKRVRFALTYDDAVSGDEFHWVRSDGKSTVQTTKPALDVPATATKPVCVTVRVARSGTGLASPASRRTCST